MNLPMEKTIKCSVMYKNCPTILNQEEFGDDVEQSSEFDVILRMDWLLRHRAKIDSRKQRVSLRGKRGGKMYF